MILRAMFGLILNRLHDQPNRQKKRYPERDPEINEKAGRILFNIPRVIEKESDLFLQISSGVSEDERRDHEDKKREQSQHQDHT